MLTWKYVLPLKLITIYLIIFGLQPTVIMYKPVHIKNIYIKHIYIYTHIYNITWIYVYNLTTCYINNSYVFNMQCTGNCHSLLLFLVYSIKKQKKTKQKNPKLLPTTKLISYTTTILQSTVWDTELHDVLLNNRKVCHERTPLWEQCLSTTALVMKCILNLCCTRYSVPHTAEVSCMYLSQQYMILYHHLPLVQYHSIQLNFGVMRWFWIIKSLPHTAQGDLGRIILQL